MFPHTITLIKKNSDGTYNPSRTISEVYWDESKNKRLNNKEMEKGSAVSIVAPISKESLFNLGDIVMKGIYNLNINSIAELEDYDYSTIISKSVYDVGSSIDNVVLQCQ